MTDQPVDVPPTAVPETQPSDNSIHSHHSVSLIPVRNSSDQEIKDAVDGVLRTVSAADLLSTSRMMISLETVQGASPICLYYLKHLYDSKGFRYTSNYTDVFIRNIFTDMLYADSSDVADRSSRTRLSGSFAARDLKVTRLQRANQPIPADTLPTSSKPPPVAGHFSRAIFNPLPNVHPRGVHSRIGDLVKYYSTPHLRYSGRPSQNQSLSMHHESFTKPDQHDRASKFGIPFLL